VHLPDMVPSVESKRGRQTTERQSSPARSMAPELNGSEGANPLGQGAALGSGKPLGPAHSEREVAQHRQSGGKQRQARQ
jgi:hypothetical protein